MSDIISELANVAGILPGYNDMTGQWRTTSLETKIALLSAMGIESETEPQARRSLDAMAQFAHRKRHGQWQVVETGSVPTLDIDQQTEWQIVFEDGSQCEGRGAQSLPALPLGRHTIEIHDEKTTLISAPCALPAPPRGWGAMLPLAGIRGVDRGGFGDYADLQSAAIGLGRNDAGFVGINPVHAGFPTDHGEISPYAPSHRRRLNILHVAVTDSAGPISCNRDLIDFASLIPEKHAALRKTFIDFEAQADKSEFEAYIAAEGQALTDFATHQALSAIHGPYWCGWPAALQDPRSPQTASARSALTSELRFHCWLQWQAEQQLASASNALHQLGMTHGLYLDIAVGTHPWGAETWMERDQFATEASLGAPPDAFSSEGQVWGLAPFNPHSLARDGFRALSETLRKQLQFAQLLRIDHILGFERAFWVPLAGGLPGAYVQMPREAMLAIVRMEAARANATIIGEDLGNIPDGLQDALARSGILGCRVVIFENRVADGGGFIDPGHYPEQTLASFSTHDLPTWLGWRRYADISARRQLGQLDPEATRMAQRHRSGEIAAFDSATGSSGDTPDRMFAFLGSVASRLVALQIEDILEVEAQPNLPGTIHEYPNWRQRLPVGHMEFATEPRIARAAEIMKAAGR